MKSEELDKLLKPAVDAFKREATAAINAVTERMTNVLRVTYATEPGMVPKDCPAPRFQFRWVENHPGFYTCHYEFIFPLDRADVRSIDSNNSLFAVVELGRTRTNSEIDFGAGLAYEAPFRDGTHVQWDAKHFGNPPTYIISPDGRFTERKLMQPLNQQD